MRIYGLAVLVGLAAGARPASKVQLTRRAAAICATGLLTSRHALKTLADDERGGVSWSITLDDDFAVSRQLASIVRVRVETMLAAEDPRTGAQVKLLLLPFGAQAAASLSGDQQLALADFFLSSAPPTAEGATAVSSSMTASAALSPSVFNMRSFGTPSYASVGGHTHVFYRYSYDKCTGDAYEGECLGSLAPRRTLAAVTMSSLSQYRTNTERERMRELGQVRNVDVLWLLTLSAPGAAWEQLSPRFERMARSFVVRDPTG